MTVRLAIRSTRDAVERLHLLDFPFAFNIVGYVKPTGSYIGGKVGDVDSKCETESFKQSSGVVGRPSTKRCWGL